MNLIVDMNLSPRWVEHLQKSGFEAQHWSTLGAASASDRSIMDFARDHDSVVPTHDLDFGDILAATGGDKPSVVQIRATNTNPETIGPQIVTALNATRDDLKLGALLTIDAGACACCHLFVRRIDRGVCRANTNPEGGDGGFLWLWIEPHKEYDRLVG